MKLYHTRLGDSTEIDTAYGGQFNSNPCWSWKWHLHDLDGNHKPQTHCRLLSPPNNFISSINRKTVLEFQSEIFFSTHDDSSFEEAK